jgi:hypothetical protein
MRRIVISCLCLLMLGGCASKYVNRTWVRVDGRQAPQKRLDADLAFCNAQTGRLQMSQPNLSNAQLDEYAANCLLRRGWRAQ